MTNEQLKDYGKCCEVTKSTGNDIQEFEIFIYYKPFRFLSSNKIWQRL